MTYSAHNAAIYAQYLTKGFGQIQAVEVLLAEDRPGLAGRMIDVSTQVREARAIKKFLFERYPDGPTVLDPAPKDPVLDAMLADADARLEIANARYQEVYAEVAQLAQEIVARTPGAPRADTAMA